MPEDKPITAYKVSLGAGTTPYVETVLETALLGIEAYIDDMDVGGNISITKIETTQRAFESLPDWSGP